MRPLVAVGRYPLMAFLGHRFLMQGINALMARSSAFSPFANYWLLWLSTLAVLVALSEARMATPRLDAAFKRIWL